MLIDHIWTNSLETVCDQKFAAKSEIIMFDASDHLPTTFIHNLGTVKTKNKTKVKFRVVREENIAKFKQLFNLKHLHKLNLLLRQSLSPDEKYNTGIQDLQKLYDECFPWKTKSTHNKILQKPWITNELQRKIKKRVKMHSQMLKNRQTSEKYKEYKNHVCSELRKAKIQYFKNKINESGNDTRKKWEVIRVIICKGKKVRNTCPISGDELCSHYVMHPRRLYEKIPKVQDLPSYRKPTIKEPDKRPNNVPQFKFDPISSINVHNKITKLDDSKGPGSDGIGVKPLKSIAKTLSPIESLL